MKTLRHLFCFDYPRCRSYLLQWWFCCAAVFALSFAVILGDSETLRQPAKLVHLFIYVLLIICVGVVMQPLRTNQRNGFFSAMPVSASELVKSRLVLINVSLLIPFYLAQLPALFFVDPTFGAWSAFSFFFWGIHYALIVFFSVVAGLSKSMTHYLVRTLVWGSVFIVVSGFLMQSRNRDPNIVFVDYPEAYSLLWSVGLCFLGGGLFTYCLLLVYKGRSAWRAAIYALVCLIVLFYLLPQPNFRLNPDFSMKPLASDQIHADQLTYSMENRHEGFDVQRNGDDGSTTIGGRSKPPYVDSLGEEFWFIRGGLTIEGLDPEYAYAAKLVSAKWISQEGVELEFAPPPGTENIMLSHFSRMPPPATEACLDTLLGTAPKPVAKRFANHAELVLFAAWTSDYERFKTTPGKLQLQARVDFYRHEIGLNLLLNGFRTHKTRFGRVRLGSVEAVADELSVELDLFNGSQTWRMSPDLRWSSRSNWVLHSSNTLERATYNGGGSGHQTFYSVRRSYHRLRFSEQGRFDNFPDFKDVEPLSLIRIVPVYLGSKTVDLVVEDFQLVTDRSASLL